jgi:hypothetical protein
VRDRDLDGLLERWAAHETASAPELGPTPDMYRSVRALKPSRRRSPFLRRWLALSAAAAALLVLAVIYPAIFRPTARSPAWPGHGLDIVGTREAPAPKKGAVKMRAVEKAEPRADAVQPKRGEKGRPVFLSKAEFEVTTGRSPEVSRFDLRGPREEALSLTSDDIYRLVLEPAQDVHVYVFQISPAGRLIRLFPNETYSNSRNPLERGLLYHLPSEPNWFYLGPDKGEERLYLLASPEPLSDLGSLYAEYTGEITLARRRALLSDLLDRFESIMAGGRGRARGWMLAFRHR